MIPIVLLVTAIFRPGYPTVGDRVTITFDRPVVLEKSPDFEVLTQRGNVVVIRSFNPKPFRISGRAGDTAFSNVVVPMRSVLRPRDNMEPAPLKPPRREEYPRLPFIAIGLAALAAIAAWTAAVLRRERAVAAPMPAIPPAEQFRATVIALREDRNARMRWARLADALREYLAATTTLGRDLTTREVLAHLGGAPASAGDAGRSAGAPQIVAQILRQGDLEKFSPWGPAPDDFNEVASQALELVAETVSPEQEAA